MTLKLCTNTKKLTIILSLTLAYFFAELIVGTWIKSISLVADSFHMLSDVVSIIIGIIAIRLSKLPKSAMNTFGWQRAEVFGSLVNCISLMSLCFTIFVSAIQRLFDPERVTDPMTMLFVSAGGLIINFIGLLVLSSTHSHNAISTVPMKIPNYVKSVDSDGESTLIPTENQTDNDSRTQTGSDSNTQILEAENPLSIQPILIINEEQSMNMSAVFLHVFADFVGSIIVFCSALLLLYGPGDVNTNQGKYKLYVDPSLSILMVVIIILPTFSLVKQAALLLLQSVPQEINIKKLSHDLHQINNVVSIHELHVWRLQPRVIIGTVHVKVKTIDDFNCTSKMIKKLFHDYNIHCTTIQPEFSKISSEENEDNKCEMTCDPSSFCKPNVCCPRNDLK